MKLALAAAFGASVALLSYPGHAQSEVVAMMTELTIAPDVCKWADAASSYKIDQQIDEQLKLLNITPDQWRVIRNQAKVDLLADPTNCAPSGPFRALYDEAAK
jgi:hypothetical protein